MTLEGLLLNPLHLLAVAGALFMIGVCGLALVKGDAPEQQGGAIVFVCWAATLAVELDGNFRFTERSVIAIDVVLFVALGWIGLKSSRSWPIWACAFQAIALFSEISHQFGLKADGFTYFLAVNISGNGLLMSMAAGAVVAWREREALRSFGLLDQPSTSSPASARAIRSSVRPTPKMATKDPNRGPWF